MGNVVQIQEKLEKLIEFGISEKEIIEKYEENILSLKNVSLSYVFAKNIKGADIESHLRAAMKYSGPNAHLFFREKLKDKYEILSSYYFIDDALDEIKKENSPEEYSLICKKR